MYFSRIGSYNKCMTNQFVTVQREVFIQALEQAGFSPDPEAYGELVYMRQHHIDKTMYIKIFTSLPLAGGNTRALGADAIRVLLIFKNPNTGKSGCLFKALRVYRTGTAEKVIERAIQRARDCYRIANKRCKGIK